MAATKKTPRKLVSMEDEDRAFFEHAYKHDPVARAAMDAEGRAPIKKSAVKAPAAKAAKAPAKKTGKK